MPYLAGIERSIKRQTILAQPIYTDERTLFQNHPLNHP